MSKPTTLFVSSLTLATFSLAACAAGPRGGGGGGGPESNAPVVDELLDPTHASLAGCATGDVEENLEIVRELRDSYHEMIVCGGLAVGFTVSVATVITNALQGKRGIAGFTYQGNGTYSAGNGMMLVHAAVATDVGSWKKGDALASMDSPTR
jgi:hypothetical protein